LDQIGTKLLCDVRACQIDRQPDDGSRNKTFRARMVQTLLTRWPMQTGELSLDLLMTLDGAALEVRRFELLELLIELTGTPPEDAPIEVVRTEAKAMVERRAWVVEALTAVGLPTETDLIEARIETLMLREAQWKNAVEG
jgi:hypothetical protein